eukprot:Awhi_evm1s13377
MIFTIPAALLGLTTFSNALSTRSIDCGPCGDNGGCLWVSKAACYDWSEETCEMNSAAGYTYCPSVTEYCGPNGECSNGAGVSSIPCCHDANKICDFTERLPMTGEGTCNVMTGCSKSSVYVSNVPLWTHGLNTYNLNGEWSKDESTNFPLYTLVNNETLFHLYPYKSGGNNPGWTFFSTSGAIWIIHSNSGLSEVTEASGWSFQGNAGNQKCGEEVKYNCFSSTDLTNVAITCEAPVETTTAPMETTTAAPEVDCAPCGGNGGCLWVSEAVCYKDWSKETCASYSGYAYCPSGTEPTMTDAPEAEYCGPYGECSDEVGVSAIPCCNHADKICDFTERLPNTGEGTCNVMVGCSAEDSSNVFISKIPFWTYSNETYDLNGEWIKDEAADFPLYKYEKKGLLFHLYPYKSGGNSPGWTVFSTNGAVWIVHSNSGLSEVTEASDWTFQGNAKNRVCGGEVKQNCFSSDDLTKIKITCEAPMETTTAPVKTTIITTAPVETTTATSEIDCGPCGSNGGCLWVSVAACYDDWSEETCARYSNSGYAYCPSA